MMPPTLDSDVLRIIIQYAANSGFDPSEPFSKYRWLERARLLRHLALVNSQWRSLAQLELDSYLMVTSSNLHLVLRAAQRGALARRAKKVTALWIDSSSDPRALDSILEQCEEVQILESYGGTFSLNSLAKAKHLRSLTLHNVTLYGGHDDLVLPCRLSSVSLLGFGRFGRSDWKTLRAAAEGSLRHLCIRELPLNQVNYYSNTLLHWFPTVETLVLEFRSLPRNIMSLLDRCDKLVRFRLNIADLSHVLPILTRSLLSLDISPRSMMTASAWDEHLLFLRTALGKFPLDHLESLKIPQELVDDRSVRASVHEVVEVANAKGIEVVFY
ncbi:hypothetical protein JCM1840_005912 [Sporobolomyces johnsonii]